MKKFSLFGNGAVMSGVSILMVMLLSCNKMNTSEFILAEENTLKTVDFVKPEDYGEYHNRILSAYLLYDSQSPLNLRSDFNPFKSLKEFNDMIVEIKKTLDSKNVLLINENDYRLSIENIDNVFADFKDENLEIDYYLLTQKVIELHTSKRVGMFLEGFLYGKYSFEEIVKYIDLFKENNVLTNEELNMIVKFEVTLKASKEFWDVYQKNNIGSYSKCDPQEQVFLADAFGALLGGVSAVGYSYAVYKLQDNGEHCI